jgi:hypothetical protein
MEQLSGVYNISFGRSGFLYLPIFNRNVLYFSIGYTYIKESKRKNNINRNV